MASVWIISVATYCANTYLTSASTNNGMASMYFSVKYNVCSKHNPFVSKRTGSTIECLGTCLHHIECVSADWVWEAVHLGVCNLFKKNSTISGQLYSENCQHYERANHHDCHSWYEAGMRETGVYELTLDNIGHVPVYCVMDATSGGWTVFHRRFDGSLDFNQNWTTYREGFGGVSGEHWLGLNKIIEIMKYRPKHELSVGMESLSCEFGTAMYSTFNIEGDLYKLTVSGYTGNVGDSLGFSNQMNFSTHDMDNDNHKTEHCAKLYRSGWWFNSCHHANLNGNYYSKAVENWASMCWPGFTNGKMVSLRKAQMMFM